MKNPARIDAEKLGLSHESIRQYTDELGLGNHDIISESTISHEQAYPKPEPDQADPVREDIDEDTLGYN